MSDFTLIRVLKEGDFGKISLMCDKDDTQMVFKEILASKMSFEKYEAARKETLLVASLHCSHIVKFHRQIDLEKSFVIVTEFCEGGDLTCRIEKQRGVLFSEGLVLDWFAQLCLAVKHIHDHKVLHRDIKPKNIFLTDKGMVKLGDFGVARVLSSMEGLVKTWIGTPFYLSPEMTQQQEYGTKSDIWSLGCVLYELLTLKRPFDAPDITGLLNKIQKASYASVANCYHNDVKNLVRDMLCREPKSRPSINGILRRSFILDRCRKVLNEAQYNQLVASTSSPPTQPTKKVPRSIQKRPSPVPDFRPRRISVKLSRRSGDHGTAMTRIPLSRCAVRTGSRQIVGNLLNLSLPCPGQTSLVDVGGSEVMVEQDAENYRSQSLQVHKSHVETSVILGHCLVDRSGEEGVNSKSSTGPAMPESRPRGTWNDHRMTTNEVADLDNLPVETLGEDMDNTNESEHELTELPALVVVLSNCENNDCDQGSVNASGPGPEPESDIRPFEVQPCSNREKPGGIQGGLLNQFGDVDANESLPEVGPAYTLVTDDEDELGPMNLTDDLQDAIHPLKASESPTKPTEPKDEVQPSSQSMSRTHPTRPGIGCITTVLIVFGLLMLEIFSRLLYGQELLTIDNVPNI